MPKLADWEARLTHLVSATHGKTFAWGTLDCCLWAAACVEAQTGVDHAAPFRGTYGDVAGAARIVKRLGGLRGIGVQAGPEVPPLMARHGDIGLVRAANGKRVLALCAGPVWLLVSSQGVLSVPLASAINCWRTGDA